MWTSEEAFKAELARVATANAEAMSTMSKKQQRTHVRRVMKAATVVYAIWHEGEYQHCWCIKGIDTPEGTFAGVTAFVVDCAESAVNMRCDWGDGPTSPELMN
jgi:hypothetical protein